MNTLPVVHTVLLELTRRCIRRCRHCSVEGSCKQPLSLMDRMAHHLIREAGSMGVSQLDLTGGEPLESPSFLTVLREAQSVGIQIGVCATTGELLNDSMLDRIGMISGRLPVFSISLDGIDQITHGFLRGNHGFDQVMNSIETIGRRGGECWLVTMLHRANCERLLEILSWIEARPWITKWKIAVCRPSGRGSVLNCRDLPPDIVVATESLRREVTEKKPRVQVKIADFFKYNWLTCCVRYQKDDHPCEYLKGVVTVSSDGKVSSCPPGLDCRETFFQFGHITDVSFSKIICGEAHRKFWDLSISDLPKCRECAYTETCGGGCRANAIFYGRGYTGCDPVANNRVQKIAVSKSLF